LQTIYLLKADSFEPNKPTVLFVHGSGTGPFPVFNGLFNDLRGVITSFLSLRPPGAGRFDCAASR